MRNFTFINVGKAETIKKEQNIETGTAFNLTE